MKNQLILTPIAAFTVHSDDDEYRSSDKGIYRTRKEAEIIAPKSGWYGSNGEVRNLDDIFEDGTGTLYSVSYIGRFTNEEKLHTERTWDSIKSKLTAEEIRFLNI